MMFSDWIYQKYLDWRGDGSGQKYSVAAFSRFLDLRQQDIDIYIKGPTVPTEPNIINKLIDKYGAEALAALGLILNENSELAVEIDHLPAELYPELIQRIKELRLEHILQPSAGKEKVVVRSAKKPAQGQSTET